MWPFVLSQMWDDKCLLTKGPIFSFKEGVWLCSESQLFRQLGRFQGKICVQRESPHLIVWKLHFPPLCRLSDFYFLTLWMFVYGECFSHMVTFHCKIFRQFSVWNFAVRSVICQCEFWVLCSRLDYFTLYSQTFDAVGIGELGRLGIVSLPRRFLQFCGVGKPSKKVSTGSLKALEKMGSSLSNHRHFSASQNVYRGKKI